MSWSVNEQGMPAVVRELLAARFAAINCVEPEQTIKNKIAEAVDAALAAMPVGTPVEISASGSQSGNESSAINAASLSIKPMYGFRL